MQIYIHTYIHAFIHKQLLENKFRKSGAGLQLAAGSHKIIKTYFYLRGESVLNPGGAPNNI